MDLSPSTLQAPSDSILIKRGPRLKEIKHKPRCPRSLIKCAKPNNTNSHNLYNWATNN